MSLGSFYKGTTHSQDARFANKEKKLIEKWKFPAEFDEEVDIDKVEMKVIKQWIERKLTEIFGFEDEFLINYTVSLLESKEEKLNPKKMQINLTGFLDKDTPAFMQNLWKLLLSAQKSPLGIPEEFIKEKKEELVYVSKDKQDNLKFLENLLKIEESQDIQKEVIEKQLEQRSPERNKRDKERRKSRSRSRSRDRKSHRDRERRRKTFSRSRSRSRSRDRRRRRHSSSDSKSVDRKKNRKEYRRSRERDSKYSKK